MREKIDAYGLDQVCASVLDGESMTALSARLGVSKGLLIAWIAADPDRSARVYSARAEAAVLWDEASTIGIAAASDPFELSRAKELAHHYRWRASKIAPKVYGDKVEHSGADGAPLFPTVNVTFNKD